MGYILGGGFELISNWVQKILKLFFPRLNSQTRLPVSANTEASLAEGIIN
jgi:hypothetical protein